MAIPSQATNEHLLLHERVIDVVYATPHQRAKTNISPKKTRNDKATVDHATPINLGKKTLMMRTNKLKISITPRVFFTYQTAKTSNSILLTFDDGPHPTVTREVLDVLDIYETKAVFFVVGNRIQRAPHMLHEILTRGHVLGNHTYSHLSGKQLGLLEYKRDLLRCQAEVSHHVSYNMKLHRPPYGVISAATSFSPRIVGLRSVLWSLSSEDWQLSSFEQCAPTSCKLATIIRPRDILLFHDEKPYTPRLIHSLIPKILERGFSLASPHDL